MLPSLPRVAAAVMRAAVLLLVVALYAPTPARAEIRITDVLGRTVVLPKPAERIVLGFYFEDFLAIAGPGGADKLRAVSLFYWQGYRPGQYAAYLRALPLLARLADIGDTDNGTMSAEKIVAARPDLAILSAAQYQYLGASAATIEAAGIPIVTVDYNAQTLEKHVASTLAIGAAIGTSERAERLVAQYREKLADTQRRIAGAGTPPKRVYVEVGQQGPAEFGNSYGRGMWAGTIEAAGGRNIAAGKIPGTGPMNPEDVLASRPEVIVLTGSEWLGRPRALLLGFGVEEAVTRARLRPYLDRPGWAELPAVRDGAVYALYHGGTRTLSDYAYLRFVAKALYPDAFADVDPLAELAAYYRDNLPVALDGTFMLRLGEGPTSLPKAAP